MSQALLLTPQGSCRNAQDNFNVLQALLLDDIGWGFFQIQSTF